MYPGTAQISRTFEVLHSNLLACELSFPFLRDVRGGEASVYPLGYHADNVQKLRYVLDMNLS